MVEYRGGGEGQGTQESIYHVYWSRPNPVIRNYTTQHNLLQCHILDLAAPALISTYVG